MLNPDDYIQIGYVTVGVTSLIVILLFWCLNELRKTYTIRHTCTDGNQTSIWLNNKTKIWTFQTRNGSYKIKYCPFCGIELKEPEQLADVIQR